MAETTSDPMPAGARTADNARMPAAAKWTVLVALAALLGGAVVLLALRGEALLLDLSALGGRIFCL